MFRIDSRGIAYQVFNDGSVSNWPIVQGNWGNGPEVEYYYSMNPKAALTAKRKSRMMWIGSAPDHNYTAEERLAFLG